MKFWITTLAALVVLIGASVAMAQAPARVTVYCTTHETMLNAITILVNEPGSELAAAYIAETPECSDGLVNPELVIYAVPLAFDKTPRSGSSRRRNGERYVFHLTQVRNIANGEIVYTFTAKENLPRASGLKAIPGRDA